MIQNIKFICTDGTLVSISYGRTAYCMPRRDTYDGYSQVEIGLWVAPIPELVEYADGCVYPDGKLTVYGYVPIALLAKLIAAHC